MPDPSTQRNAEHYDAVTDAWALVLGANFHYGYFPTPETDLSTATAGLVEALADLGPLRSGYRVLDVGCGIGTPAFHLYRRYGCRVIGISTSARGIAVARETGQEQGYGDHVQFELREAIDNRFPDCAFDVVWQMESAHLIRDKAALFAEHYRVLKPGGMLLLCDVILKKPFDIAGVYRHRKELAVLTEIFGDVKLEPIETHEIAMARAGFVESKSAEVGDRVAPTFRCWRANLKAHWREISDRLAEERALQFLRACDILEAWFAAGVLGYVLLRAQKNTEGRG